MEREIVTLSDVFVNGEPFAMATQRFIDVCAERFRNKVIVVDRFDDFGIVVVDSDLDVDFEPFAFLAPFTRRVPGKTKGLELTAPVKPLDVKPELPWHINFINAPTAWTRCDFGRGVKVAILDTGIKEQPSLPVAGGVCCLSGCDTFDDDHDHGTQCASILAARPSAGSKVVGVAPEAQLYAVKVLDSGCEGDSVAALKGMYWAYTERMEVVSMSLAETEESCALEFYTRAIEVLNSIGCVVVAGAGNVMPDTNGTVRAPANSPGVIAVGSISEEGAMLENSAFGVMRDCKIKANESPVLAPGINIMTIDKDGEEDGFGGTSAACPQVAGLVALLKCQSKGITPKDVISKVTSSARKLSAGRLGYNKREPGTINCDLATRDITGNQ